MRPHDDAVHSEPMDTSPLWQLRTATTDDLDWIHGLRHRVYATELGQHAPTPDGRLVDDLDGRNVYLVAASGEERVGFVSLTLPWAGPYSLEKYLARDELPLLEDEPFEVRILTVEAGWRRSGVGLLLMYASLRWISSRGGRTVVAMGRSDLLDMYRAVGFETIGRSVRSGVVDFQVMTASIARGTALALGPYASLVAQWRAEVDWQLDVAFSTGPDGCEHGGASFTAIGTDFRTLERRRRIVAADVLDAWFPPAPAVVEALRFDPEWLARTSPPADGSGLIAAISEARGLPAESLVLGSGSSDLIFRSFSHWLTPQSRVLLVDPGYGEYAHVTERVLSCQVDRFAVRRSEGWRIDPDRLADAVSAHDYDLVVVVNPNNPTGRHAPSAELRAAVAASPRRTRWWIDEAYLGYVDLAESLADLAASDSRVVVCTSLSKMYALSGMRAAFLVAEPGTAADLRRRTPPWQVSLPAQLAAVAALGDPEYYRTCWGQTHALRRALGRELATLGLDVEEAVANFVTVLLPAAGPSAAAFVAECRTHGVYLRDLSPMSPAYEGRTVRIAVKSGEENVRIREACRAALARLRPAPVVAVAGRTR
jgi:histidinol-phosphate/aromatic aminotransferase/cobyric acid decarboxylase-like protein/N-acyl-L-homoserine lactone synthetase